MAARNAYFPLFIILNRWKIRGRPFDSEGGGGGWQILSGQIIYFHHELGRIIYFQVYQGPPKFFLIKLLQNHAFLGTSGGYMSI